MSLPRSIRHVVLLSLFASGAQAAAPPAEVYLVASQDTWRGFSGSAMTPRVDGNGHPVVLVQADADRVAALSRYVHEVESRCGGYFSFPTRAEAEAFLQARPVVRGGPRGGYTIDNPATVEPWLPLVSAANIADTISALESFHNRHYQSATGAEAAEWIRDQWLALADGRDDVHAELFTDCNDCGVQPSVILTIEGTTYPDEIVVLGGHLDSINRNAGGSSSARAPGADDDASGIASLTEILRIAMESGYRPQRTVHFMGYAAEEVGLNGSQAIASQYAGDDRNVVAALQLDMTNYHESGQVDIEFISDNVDGTLTAWLADVFDAYLAPLGLTRGSSPCGYGCSDHSSWTAAGYPSAFVFEGGGMGHDFGLIHTANDLLANMDDSAEHSVPFAQLGLAFLGEVAKGESMPLDIIFANGFEPVPNVAPRANFTYTADGFTFSFQDASTDEDGSIVSWSWDFGDGGTATIASPEHAYAAAGTYTVTLTVTDDDGDADSYTRSVQATTPPTPLLNGVPVTALSDTTGGEKRYAIEIPAGASNLVIQTSGGSGDLDLYVRRATPPSIEASDCGSESSTNNEYCVFESPAAGTWHVLLYAWSSYDGVTLTGSFDP